MDLDEFKTEVSARAGDRGAAVVWEGDVPGGYLLTVSCARWTSELRLRVSGLLDETLLAALVEKLVDAAAAREPRGFELSLSRPESSADADDDAALGLRLLALVRGFRDRHEITCAESVYQVDKVVQESFGLVESLVEVAGYGRIDDETDDYVPPEAG